MHPTVRDFLEGKNKSSGGHNSWTFHNHCTGTNLRRICLSKNGTYNCRASHAGGARRIRVILLALIILSSARAGALTS